MIIHGYVDDIMKKVMEELQIPIPETHNPGSKSTSKEDVEDGTQQRAQLGKHKRQRSEEIS